MNTRRAVNCTILGLGSYLPPDIRKNDWWSTEIVEKWTAKRQSSLLAGRQREEEHSTPGIALALQAMARLEADPFGGVRERRVISTEMRPSEMEIHAAQEAIHRAGVDPAEIGLLLSTSQGPDTLLVANAALIHKGLRLPRTCMATGVDAVCNGFSVQMSLAESMIRAGTIKYALLVQSSTVRALFHREDPLSPFFGDAATAVVIGPAAEGYGLLGAHHIADGSMYATLQVGNPDGHWYDAVPRAYVGDRSLARKMTLNLVDYTFETMSKALLTARVDASQLNFFAAHQGTAWIREAAQVMMQAPQARHCDTFSWTASVGPSNVPLCLALGERQGLFKNGDLVAACTGGAGATIASMIFRWGSGL